MSGQGASAAGKAKELRDRAAATPTGRAPRGQSKTALAKEAKAWKAGAKGEERVARALGGVNGLPSTTWVVLHDRLLQPDKAWNLDHLVFGPPGGFFIDAKNWRGRLRVFKGALWRHWYAGPASGRQSANMNAEVAKVSAMTDRAADRLGVPLTPVIALAGQQSRDQEEPLFVRGVHVVPVGHLKGWLSALPPMWDARSVREWGAYAGQVFPSANPDGIDRSWAQAMRTGTPHFD